MDNTAEDWTECDTLSHEADHSGTPTVLNYTFQTHSTCKRLLVKWSGLMRSYSIYSVLIDLTLCDATFQHQTFLVSPSLFATWKSMSKKKMLLDLFRCLWTLSNEFHYNTDILLMKATSSIFYSYQTSLWRRDNKIFRYEKPWKTFGGLSQLSVMGWHHILLQLCQYGLHCVSSFPVSKHWEKTWLNLEKRVDALAY